MTPKHKLRELEKFVTEEIKNKIPLVAVSDSVLIYKNIKIKKTKNGNWTLFSLFGDKIAEFKIKSTASLGAKFYHRTDFKNFNFIKVLDAQYWHSANDAELFRYKCQTAKDSQKRDLFIARYELAKSRADRYKQEITSLFKVNF